MKHVQAAVTLRATARAPTPADTSSAVPEKITLAVSAVTKWLCACPTQVGCTGQPVQVGECDCHLNHWPAHVLRSAYNLVNEGVMYRQPWHPMQSQKGRESVPSQRRKGLSHLGHWCCASQSRSNLPRCSCMGHQVLALYRAVVPVRPIIRHQRKRHTPTRTPDMSPEASVPDPDHLLRAADPARTGPTRNPVQGQVLEGGQHVYFCGAASSMLITTSFTASGWSEMCRISLPR